MLSGTMMLYMNAIVLNKFKTDKVISVRLIMWSVIFSAFFANLYPLYSYSDHGNIFYEPGYIINLFFIGTFHHISWWWWAGAIYLIVKIEKDTFHKLSEKVKNFIFFFFFTCLLYALWYFSDFVGSTAPLPIFSGGNEGKLVIASIEGSFYFYIELVLYLLLVTFVSVGKRFRNNIYTYYNILSFVFILIMFFIGIYFLQPLFLNNYLGFSGGEF